MRTASILIAAASLAVAATTVALTHDDNIAREGAGERRTALNGMELKPFPMDLFGQLASWTNGSAITAAAVEGKPVLVVTWSSWYKNSHKGLETAQRMADTFGKDGLIVVGVHDPRGFENAAKVAGEKGVKFVYAHDTGDKFREAIKSDQAPDFYVIDRAGNLRFADIETSAVERAVAIVAGESAETAAALPGSLAAKASKEAEEARKSRAVSANYRPGQILDVPFDMPDAAAYESAKWPEKNSQGLSATDVQGKQLPASFGNETWLTDKPSTAGRVVVVDFWATWCPPCRKAMPKLDEMYKTNKRDLVIIGISDEDAGKVRGFLASNRHAYPQAVDPKQTINKALQIQGIPHVVVMSTDGVVRWQGNPLDDKFRAAVESTIRADPGVQARRKAEEAHAKNG